MLNNPQFENVLYLGIDCTDWSRKDLFYSLARTYFFRFQYPNNVSLRKEYAHMADTADLLIL